MKQPLTILVVEDDAVLRKVVASLFAKIGDVATAECGNDAIAHLKQHRVDMVFSDVCMPNGDGVELLDWMQGTMSNPPPIVLVTGHASISPEEAKAKGAHSIVDKPFKMRSLLDLALQIASTLEQKPQQSA